MVDQITVFLENSEGRLKALCRTLADAGISMSALTIADTADYGVVRIICDKPTQAYRLLREQGIGVTMNDVFAIQIDNAPGQAAQLFETFSKADINISYMYSFMLKGKGIIIFRTSDTEKAREVISLNKINFISEENLTQVV